MVELIRRIEIPATIFGRSIFITLMTLISMPLFAGQATDPEKPSRWPTKEEKVEFTMPSYKPTNLRQECLGRVMWDVDGTIEWPGRIRTVTSNPFNHVFSDNVFSPGDTIAVGGVKIGVALLDQGKRKKIESSTPFAMVARFEDDIKAIKKNHTENASRDPLDHKSAQESIERLERAIERIKAEYKEFDPQLPDSIGYWTGTKAEKSFEHDKSVFRSYLFRKDHVFTFESTQYLKPPVTMEKQEQQFRALLASFRTREMHEIPSELGICIPYGFLPDDGRTAVEIKQSLRWADAPSVLYTIETGSVRANNMKSTVVHAVANAGVGLFGSAEEAAVKRFVTQRIGPKQVKIGGTTGEQGGVAYRITKPGKAPYEAYSVYTGFSGWLGTDVLPYVIVDMQTRTTEQAPELKQEPPPFKQSMARLEGLLKYMRLRPTTPVMPELR